MVEIESEEAQHGAEATVSVLVSASEGAEIPRYATSGAAGLDLRSIEEIELAPMQRMRAGTGLRIAIPAGYEGQVRPRSGLALRLGLGMVNSVGTVDSDYRGEIGVILINFGAETVKIAKGERIAQLVVCPVAHVQMVQVDQIPFDTERGEGGFGSTGTT